MSVKISQSFFEFSKQDWNALVTDDHPFQEWEFLSTLESSGCIGPKTNWRIEIYSKTIDGKLVGVFPTYLKFDSYGEYVFDFEWANAFRAAGIYYYPKVLVSSPFTPSVGKRIFAETREVESELLEAALESLDSRNLSGMHVLFHDDTIFSEDQRFLERLSIQYHFFNEGFSSFEDYLNSLTRKRRKTIRQERKSIGASGLEIKIFSGEEIDPEFFKPFYAFYQDTTGRKWGSAYLNRTFFENIFQTFRHRMVLVMAFENGNGIAGTFNFQKGKKLYGRYWGALKDISYLHFELSYYRLIEYTIANQLEIFEAGAQGEHKYLRGFKPVALKSSHFLANPQARQSIKNFLDRERNMVRMEVENMKKESPILSERESPNE